MVRIKKEARALLRPWCAVVISGALPLLVPHSSMAAKINVLSFLFGIPLLATLSLGNEFYHRTFPLWLAQPASRMQLWGEKMGVMIAAVLSAGTVCGIGMFLFALPRMHLTYNMAAAVAYVLLTMASATFWTLAARSTVGGLLLIACIFGMFYQFADDLGAAGPKAVPWSAGATTAAFAACICFAALMLWLGARRLVRFQVTGGTSGEDLLLSGPSVMPDALAGWFRVRPTGAFLNLIRKELRLLRPVWVIEFLTLPYIAFLAVVHLLPVPPVLLPEGVRQWAILGPPAMVSMGMAGLAGILSLGEERTSGTQAWQMTLPISFGLQWGVKLAVAMVAGVACSVLLPVLVMMAGGILYGSPYLYLHFQAIHDDLTYLPLLTFACFWCACAASGTIRAVVCAIGAFAAMPFASWGGILLGENLARATGTLKDFVVSSAHLSPFALAGLAAYGRGERLWLFFPTLLFALFQSYRLFRVQPQGGNRGLVRRLLPVAAVTMLWSFSAYAGMLASQWEPFEETHRALDRIQHGRTNVQLSGEELAQSSSLSRPTQRWLAGSRISVAPDLSHAAGYFATIHLASGAECRLIVTQYGGSAGSCAEPKR